MQKDFSLTITPEGDLPPPDMIIWSSQMWLLPVWARSKNEKKKMKQEIEKKKKKSKNNNNKKPQQLPVKLPIINNIFPVCNNKLSI